MNQSQINQDPTTERAPDTLEPPPNYALNLAIIIAKILLVAAAVLALAWILVNVKSS